MPETQLDGRGVLHALRIGTSMIAVETAQERRRRVGLENGVKRCAPGIADDIVGLA